VTGRRALRRYDGTPFPILFPRFAALSRVYGS